jgi:hypothetical protein
MRCGEPRQQRTCIVNAPLVVRRNRLFYLVVQLRFARFVERAHAVISASPHHEIALDSLVQHAESALQGEQCSTCKPRVLLLSLH